MTKSFTKILFIILLTWGASPTSTSAQSITVVGGFLKDSLRIGDQIPFYLTARYPTPLTILFPDSTYSFEPFEYSSKKFFATRSANGESFDSVVYELTTFEIDSIQSLTLPVYVVTRKDCTEFLTNPDSVYLISLLESPPPDSVDAQNLPLKTDTRYEDVLHLFNYPILLIVVGSLVTIVIVGWIIFGKRIRRHFRLKKLIRQFDDFRARFQNNVEDVKREFSSERTEQTLFIWKKYLEQLERKPFTKLTTRETIRMEKDETLGETLKNLDSAIYGHNKSVVESLAVLERIAEQRFSVKLEEIKNG